MMQTIFLWRPFCIPGYNVFYCLFQELVTIDCKQAAQMVLTNLSSGLADVVKRLRSDKPVLFEFLQGVMVYK